MKMIILSLLFHENDNEASLLTASFDGFRGWEHQHVSSFGANPSNCALTYSVTWHGVLSFNESVHCVLICNTSLYCVLGFNPSEPVF